MSGNKLKISWIVAAAILLLSCGDNKASYEFVVAGHAYGAHSGKNVGLYPKLIAALNGEQQRGTEFVILAGDIVRSSTTESWEKVEDELQDIGIEYFMAMGNHDRGDPGRAFFDRKFGGSFYSFQRASERYIVLDLQQKWGRITKRQLAFLDDEFSNLEGVENLFIIFHELTWTQGSWRYRHVRSNYPATYNAEFVSNYWHDVYPRLVDVRLRNSGIDIFVIAGDVGGVPPAVPAFFDEYAGVTYVATGMGEVTKENYLLVTLDNGLADMRFVDLNDIDGGWPVQEFKFREPR